MTSHDCHSQLPGVVLCFDFEDVSFQPTILDSSSGAHDANANDVGVMTRLTQHAALLDEQSSIVVPQAPPLDLAGALSIELWVYATANSDSSPFAHGDDFGVEFQDQQIGCYDGDLEPWWQLASGWHHVGCTFDGTTVATYIDGSIVACQKHMGVGGGGGGGPHPASIQIGEDFLGGIDDVHLYNRALGPPEIQHMAGVLVGVTTCPPSG